MEINDKRLAIVFVGVIVIVGLILNFFNPATIYEYVITTGFGAIVALAVPLSGGNSGGT